MQSFRCLSECRIYKIAALVLSCFCQKEEEKNCFGHSQLMTSAPKCLRSKQLRRWMAPHARREQRSAKNGNKRAGTSITETTGGLSYAKLANWIFTELWKKYESGLCHWMASFQGIWWNGKSLVCAPLIRTTAELLLFLTLDLKGFYELLLHVEHSAYVPSLRAHLTSKHSEQFPVYRRFKVLQ